MSVKKKIQLSKFVPKKSLNKTKVQESKPIKRIFSIEELLNLFDRKIISSSMVRERLGIEEPVISEKHPVAIKAIGNHGSIGLLHLYVDGSALFVPKVKATMPVNNFESTGLTFTIEPISLEIEEETEEDVDVDVDVDASLT